MSGGVSAADAATDDVAAAAFQVVVQHPRPRDLAQLGHAVHGAGPALGLPRAVGHSRAKVGRQRVDVGHRRGREGSCLRVWAFNRDLEPIQLEVGALPLGQTDRLRER